MNRDYRSIAWTFVAIFAVGAFIKSFINDPWVARAEERVAVADERIAAVLESHRIHQP